MAFSAVLLFSLMATVALAMTTPAADSHEEHGHSHPPPTLSGPCPQFQGTDLDVSKISGDWFVLQCGKDGFEMKGDRGRCVKMTVTAEPNGGMAGSVTMLKDGKTLSHSSTDVPIEGRPGSFTITTTEMNHNKTAVLTILDTDYKNYGTGVVCIEHDGKHGLFTEIIGRQKELDKALLEKAKASFTAAKITTELSPVDQTC